MTKTPQGFTLIELVIAIVVVAIAAVAIGSAYAYMTRAQVLGPDLQRASQIAQECAEHIVGLRRKPGWYAALTPFVGANSAVCNGLPPISAGFTRTVNITDVAGAGASFCAAGWACRRVEVVAQRGNALVRLNFMFVYY